MSRRSWWVIPASALIALVGCGTEAEPVAAEAPPELGPVIRVPGGSEPGEAVPSESSISPQRLRETEPNGCAGQTVFCWPVNGGCWLIGTVCSGGVLMCEYQCPPIVIKL
jgi:hypothetical protein